MNPDDKEMQNLANLLKDPEAKKYFAAYVFRVITNLVLFSVIGITLIKIYRMEDKDKAYKLNYIMSFFGLGSESEVKKHEEEKQKEEYLKENLYKEVEMLKEMNKEWKAQQ